MHSEYSNKYGISLVFGFAELTTYDALSNAKEKRVFLLHCSRFFCNFAIFDGEISPSRQKKK